MADASPYPLVDFHNQVTKGIAAFIKQHPEEVGVIHMRVLLITALLYEDNLDGGRRAWDLLDALGR